MQTLTSPQQAAKRQALQSRLRSADEHIRLLKECRDLGIDPVRLFYVRELVLTGKLLG